MTDKLRLTRRKVLGGLASIGAASVAAGAGTMALFSDTEDSTGNTVSAGTLTLDPAGSSDGSSFSIAVSGLVPDKDGTEVGYLDLKNTGSVAGELSYELTDWTDYENGRNEAEEDAGDSTGGDPGAGQGELSQVLEIDAWVDDTPATGGRNNHHHITSGWVGISTGEVNTGQSIDPCEEIRIWVDARIPETTGNKVQSDSVEVDVVFILRQT